MHTGSFGFMVHVARLRACVKTQFDGGYGYRAVSDGALCTAVQSGSSYPDMPLELTKPPRGDGPWNEDEVSEAFHRGTVGYAGALATTSNT